MKFLKVMVYKISINQCSWIDSKHIN